MAYESDIKINDIKMIGQAIPRKTILLKPNFPLVSVHSELQSVFTDLTCTKCISCMERAIKANKMYTHLTKTKPNTQELENDVLVSYYHYRPPRDKRNTEKTFQTANVESTTPKKLELKRNKTVTVTKYNTDGQVYAVKIQEGNLEDDHKTDMTSSSCEVYSVRKYFPCDSPGGELMLTMAKRKINKRSKKEQAKNKPTLTTEKALQSQPQSKASKRQVDESQLPERETLMTSIEELY